jgi:hypothetical protein
MIKFAEFVNRKQFSVTVDESSRLLTKINIKSEDYLNYLFEHEELWDKDPVKVLNEINPFSAGWSALKGGLGAMGGNRNAAYYQKLLDQAKTLPPEKLQQAGLTPEDLNALDQMRADSAKQGAAGFFGGMKQGWENSRQQQVLNKLSQALGKGAYSQQTQQQQQQGQNQQSQGQQQQSGQQMSQVNPQALRQVQGHLQALNQAISGMLQGG